MKSIRRLLPVTALVACLNCAQAQTQPTAFTYQGRLNDTNGPLSGSFDFIFSLYDNEENQLGPKLTNTSVAVVEGCFTRTLDFGADSWVRRWVMTPRPHFEGPGEWLEIMVREHPPTGKPIPYVLLDPRQHLTPTPFAAALSGPLQSGALEGTYSGTVNFSHPSNQFCGTFTGDGANLTGVDAATLGGLGVGSFWRLAGNAGTTEGTHFLGTTDERALELRVANSRALRLQPGYYGPSLIGGYRLNAAPGDVSGAVIAGGGRMGHVNQVNADFGFVGGGRGNTVHTNAVQGTIGGGYGNSILLAATNATIGGGQQNSAGGVAAVVAGGRENQALGENAAVAGGRDNMATGAGAIVGGGDSNQASGEDAVVGGGHVNLATNQYATVGGGDQNLAAGPNATVAGGAGNWATNTHTSIGGGLLNRAGGTAATVPGGRRNAALGEGSFAAGRDATIRGPGSFLWNDGASAQDFSETNGFIVVANGGAHFHTGANPLWTSGDLSCAALTIRGGADLAEPFAVSGDNIPAGAVVVIDEHNPGRLKLSTQACDPKVAGIVSGAGGVRPGISMIQAETLAGGRNVALSGRVYALVDATKSPVAPGDLLTTSDTPGHAMKATDPVQAQGAILGKAMSRLEKGRGLVLVLVSLQ